LRRTWSVTRPQHCDGARYAAAVDIKDFGFFVDPEKRVRWPSVSLVPGPMTAGFMTNYSRMFSWLAIKAMSKLSDPCPSREPVSIWECHGKVTRRWIATIHCDVIVENPRAIVWPSEQRCWTETVNKFTTRRRPVPNKFKAVPNKFTTSEDQFKQVWKI